MALLRLHRKVNVCVGEKSNDTYQRKTIFSRESVSRKQSKELLRDCLAERIGNMDFDDKLRGFWHENSIQRLTLDGERL